MELPVRSEVPEKLTWDLTLIYKTEEECLADEKRAEELCARIESAYKGKLTAFEAMDACVSEYMSLRQILDKTGSYRELAACVDYYNTAAMEKKAKSRAAKAEIEARLSFIDSEILLGDIEVLRSAALKAGDNKLYFEDLLRNRPHTLGAETEKILAQLKNSLSAPYTVYNVTKLADMRFPSFTVNGEEYPLGYSLFEDDYEYDARTDVRRAAFRAFSDKLAEYENTTAAVYNTHVQTEKIMASVRGFDGVFDYLLFTQHSDAGLYNRQIDLIMERLAPHMRRFARLLGRIHKLDKITYADLKLPVDPGFCPEITVEQARKYITEGLSVMGQDYTDIVNEAFDKRWVDFARNKGKETGGFCASLYKANSYILLTWNNRMSDVMTLAHELGHAANFRLTSGARPFYDTYAGSMLTSEAPSTANELIMGRYLLTTDSDKRFRRWMLANIVSNTYYHNFVTHLLEAAYQREVYRMVDAGGSLQAETLNSIMKDTLSKFWGDAVELTEGAERTWMRQPHYYTGLYSYTYSFGLTIGTCAAERIEREGKPAVEDWKKALSKGGETSPEEFAALAGADIRTDKPLLDTIAYIGSLVEEIERLTDELENE